MTDSISKFYTDKGARFIISPDEIRLKSGKCKALLLDWDGVFNDGRKGENLSSNFSEVDAMGINMLRFSFFLVYNFVPEIIIMSGEDNTASVIYAEREHATACYKKSGNKLITLQHLKLNFGLDPENLLFIFDDVLDVPVAKLCCLRALVPHSIPDRFTEYIIDNLAADYISASISGGFALRDICEMLMDIHGNLYETFNRRASYDDRYADYLELRNKRVCKIFTGI